jgi:hypothetical protein
MIRKDGNQGELGIAGWDEAYLIKKLVPAMFNEGLIEKVDGKFRLSNHYSVRTNQHQILAGKSFQIFWINNYLMLCHHPISEVQCSP